MSTAYTVEALSGGGFVVIGPESEDWAFASTTLDEALRYIRERLIPTGREPVRDPEVAAALAGYDGMFKQNSANTHLPGKTQNWWDIVP